MVRAQYNLVRSVIVYRSRIQRGSCCSRRQRTGRIEWGVQFAGQHVEHRQSPLAPHLGRPLQPVLQETDQLYPKHVQVVSFRARSRTTSAQCDVGKLPSVESTSALDHRQELTCVSCTLRCNHKRRGQAEKSTISLAAQSLGPVLAELASRRRLLQVETRRGLTKASP